MLKKPDTKKIIFLEILFIIIISSLTIFYNLDNGSLADWDEGSYAHVSRDILSTNDWITMHFNKEPWFHKTPFFFYLVAATFKIFGTSTLTARIWPAIFGLGIILLTYFISKSWFNHKVAFMSSLILISCSQFISKSRMLMLETPLIFFIMASIYLFYLSQKKNSYYYFLGLTLGLAVMVKGLIGLIPIFIIFLYLLLTKDIKSIFKKNYLKSLIIFSVVVLPWHILELIIHGSKFINEYLVFHIFKRAVSALSSHDYGNLFYLKVLKKGLNYWFYVVIPALLFFLFKKKSRKDLLLLSWLIIPLLIFLVSKTKLPWYLIVLYPPLAILTAFFLDKLNFKNLKIGYLLFVLIFIISFHIQDAYYCSQELYDISSIAKSNLRVHDSIKENPSQLFYLGTERYAASDLIKADPNLVYLSSQQAFNNYFRNYDIVYQKRDYVLFSKQDIGIVSASQIPKSQRLPVNYCYAFMPGNLNYNFKNY